MNEMEKRRQLLEIRKQNDFFKQISSTMATSSTSVTTSAAGPTTRQRSTREAFDPMQSNDGLQSDCDAPSSGGRAAARGGADKRASCGGRPLGGGKRDDEPHETGPSESGAGVSESVERRPVAAVDEPPPPASAKRSDGHTGLTRLCDVADESDDIVQLSTGAPAPRATVGGDGLTDDTGALKLEPLSRDQLDKFVSACVPQNKRVLCLIVRDKLSRLHQAKSYFYPIYYLFIQAVVDVDEGLSGNGGNGCSENLTCCQLEQAPNECSAAAADALVDNSFSASSSISADMMFIGSASGGHELAAEVEAKLRSAGLSYSDNELNDDNTSADETLPCGAQLRLAAGAAAASPCGVGGGVGGGGVGGQNKPVDESQVHPSASRQLGPPSSFGSKFGRLVGGGGGGGGRRGRRQRRAADTGAELDEDELDEEEEEEEEEDEENDSETDLHQIDASDQDANLRAKTKEERAKLAKKYGCEPTGAGGQVAGGAKAALRRRRQQPPPDQLPRAAPAPARPQTSSANYLFEGNQNPFIGTCGVVLSGKRRKKTKT